jgi:hypothetical protein
MSLMFKRIFKFSLAVLLVIAVQRFCHIQTDGFAIEKISSSLPFHPEWEVTSSLHPELEQILSQKYRYLGKGAQCFVFLSEDRNHVIKFFRHSHMRAPLWLKLFPFPGKLETFRQEKIRIKESKLYKDFASYKIAYEEMREMTGLEYLHLNKTVGICPKITIVDKIGIAHLIDLDQMEFLVQKRADLIYPALDQMIANGEIETGKRALSSLVRLLKLRSEKGIFDKDPDLNTNFGFQNGEAVQIDIGRFKRDVSRTDPSVYREELIRITDNLRQHLDQKSPELSEHLHKEVYGVDKSSL